MQTQEKQASPQAEQTAPSGAPDAIGTVTPESTSTATADAAPPTDLRHQDTDP